MAWPLRRFDIAGSRRCATLGGQEEAGELANAVDYLDHIALAMHARYRGKIQTLSRVPVSDLLEFGVLRGRASRTIEIDPESAFTYAATRLRSFRTDRGSSGSAISVQLERAVVNWLISFDSSWLSRAND
jgi:hypothetical protein